MPVRGIEDYNCKDNKYPQYDKIKNLRRKRRALCGSSRASIAGVEAEIPGDGLEVKVGVVRAAIGFELGVNAHKRISISRDG